VRPAIVLGRNAGELVFLLPLAVTPGLARRLGFLGGGLCDYNAPLVAPDFLARLRAVDFLALWDRICDLLQDDPQLGHDVVELIKMPEVIGTKPNPFLHLDVRPNPSGAHLTRLGASWDAFYMEKRSSATRRRDRTKLKRLAEHGEVRFVDPSDTDDIRRTVEILMSQKAKAFARMGVNNLFARPGHREFFLDLATNPRTRDLVHVSRLEVGAACAAANLAYTFRDTYYHILASYDEGELARFGPGAAHLRGLLQYAIENGFRCFDFTIGDERYKLEWSDTSLKLYDHMAAATLRGWPVVFVALVFLRLKRLIKQTPFLWRLFNTLRAAAGGLRRPAKGEPCSELP
jgi:CelD/BcsL family acetyltransferase involved in cellulose biosynthesis